MRSDNTQSPVSCTCFMMIMNVLLGGVTFNYCLNAILGKDVPWYVDGICGLFVGGVTVPLTIILWILNQCGLVFPLIH